MKLNRLLMQFALLAAALAGGVAEAAPLPYTSSLGTGSSVMSQIGRLSRNGIPQDAAGDELFPGLTTPTTQYFYQTYSVFVGLSNIVQVVIDATVPSTGLQSGNIFVSVYQTSYKPNSVAGGNMGFDINWLGDVGASGFFSGTDPAYLEVTAAINSTILIVVNNTGAGGLGIFDPFTLYAQGSRDGTFGDAVDLRIPEPSTIALLAAPLALLAVRRRGKRAPALPSIA